MNATKDTSPAPKDATETKPASPLAKYANAVKRLVEAEELQLQPEAALMFMAWLHKGGKVPADPVGYALTLRSTHSIVWAAIARSDYIGLARACAFSDLPEVNAMELQTLCTELRGALPKDGPAKNRA